MRNIGTHYIGFVVRGYKVTETIGVNQAFAQLIWLVSPSIKNLSSPLLDSTRNPVGFPSPTEEAGRVSWTGTTKVLFRSGSWPAVPPEKRRREKNRPIMRVHLSFVRRNALHRCIRHRNCFTPLSDFVFYGYTRAPASHIPSSTYVKPLLDNFPINSLFNF